MGYDGWVELGRFIRSFLRHWKSAKELTAAARKRIKRKNFAIPSRADTPKEKARPGNYPIHDRTHAINALARVSQHGTPKEKAMVRRRVCQKYPDLPTCKKLKKRKNAADEIIYRFAVKYYRKQLGLE